VKETHSLGEGAFRRHIDPDDAVDLLPDAQRARWRRWSADHPQTRQPGGPADDGAGPLPDDIAAIALAGLAAKARQLRTGRSVASEEDSFTFDNDLSVLRSIEATLMEARNAVHA